MSTQYNRSFQDAIIKAVINEDTDAFMSLIKDNPNLDKETLNKALVSAAAGTPEMVEALINAGADANYALPSGNTPLLQCCNMNRHYPSSIARELIRNGADVSAVNGAGETALMTLLKYRPNETETIRLLASQDYSKLREENPEVYAEQKKVLDTWANDNPQRTGIANKYKATQDNTRSNLLDTLNDSGDKLNPNEAAAVQELQGALNKIFEPLGK